MSAENISRLLRSGIALAAAATLVLPLAACGTDPQQVQIVSGPAAAAGLTPTQRGQVRTAALRAAHEGMDSWTANDPEAMKARWDTLYVNQYLKLYKDWAAEGKSKVRKLNDIKTFDVTDMNHAGTQVIVDIYFTDGSYYTDAKGTPTSKPSNAPKQIQLTMEKRKGIWMISRMITGDEVSQ